MTDPSNTLVVRKTIPSTPERLFAAWTDPAELRRWWGPDGVTCIGSEIDLRVGGRYRIGNRLPDGTTLWIVGAFEAIERPRRLIYTWAIEGGAGAVERVTVDFAHQGSGTEVTVTHTRIETETLRRQHEHGWVGCLDGLARFVTSHS